MTMNDTLARFAQGQMTKPTFIDEMHDHHRSLYQYVDRLRQTDIAAIEITAAGVVMTTKRGGIRLVVDRDDKRIVPIETLNFGDYEAEEVDVVTAIVRALRHDKLTILDVGANIGYYSVWLAKHFREARIHAFEPIPKTFRLLVQHLDLNSITNVIPHNFGLSDREANFDFYYYKSGSGNASMADLSGSQDTERVTCTVTTLDGFVRKTGCSSIDLIKCDVEGAELLVVQGGTEALTQFQPVIFMEILRKWSAKFNYHPNDILDRLLAMGYRCFTIEHGRLAEFGRVTDDTIATNYFFIPTSRLPHLLAQSPVSIIAGLK